ncbi:hypothetical protein BOTBODRAFT_151409 [Botryobasidium botryosum FD-172 SS1]|uniref:2-dehydropantoate 2-reductase n=1 Tax=Botryobasidium botryosum (strain FD-172 SS1) TaxID=930990 RepID=A0A067NA03_BOTB1|nr:hypothetical protein BOTBODRAFT_151409 [Botryobasidium botryosum FD-172 SS1]
MAVTSASRSPVRVLIVGAGAVGCFYGSRLHRPDADTGEHVLVSLVCRSNYAAIVERRGVEMRTRAYGDYLFSPEFVFPSIAAASEKGIRWDYVVVTTKALPDLGDDSSVVSPVATPQTSIVLIQNGVGVEEPYRRRFGADVQILSAVTVVSAEQISPGIVVQNRWTRIHVGPFVKGRWDQSGTVIGENGPDHLAAKRFVQMLKDGGVGDAEACTEQQLQVIRWHKIAINGSMNPSAVLSNGTPNAEMTEDDELRHHLRQCMEEVFRGASAVLGIPFPPAGLATADKLLKSIGRNTGARPSMLVDWEHGSRMELEVILGNPIRMARERGVEMPRLEAMYGLLKMAQKRRDEKVRDNKERHLQTKL